jgi:hypothetical protein
MVKVRVMATMSSIVTWHEYVPAANVGAPEVAQAQIGKRALVIRIVRIGTSPRPVGSMISIFAVEPILCRMKRLQARLLVAARPV